MSAGKTVQECTAALSALLHLNIKLSPLSFPLFLYRTSLGPGASVFVLKISTRQVRLRFQLRRDRHILMFPAFDDVAKEVGQTAGSCPTFLPFAL